VTVYARLALKIQVALLKILYQKIALILALSLTNTVTITVMETVMQVNKDATRNMIEAISIVSRSVDECFLVS
jgi:hypothetical protein